MLVVDYLLELGEGGGRGSEEIAMRDLLFLKDVLSGMVGELVLIRG